MFHPWTCSKQPGVNNRKFGAVGVDTNIPTPQAGGHLQLLGSNRGPYGLRSNIGVKVGCVFGDVPRRPILFSIFYFPSKSSFAPCEVCGPLSNMGQFCYYIIPPSKIGILEKEGTELIPGTGRREETAFGLMEKRQRPPVRPSRELSSPPLEFE